MGTDAVPCGTEGACGAEGVAPDDEGVAPVAERVAPVAGRAAWVACCIVFFSARLASKQQQLMHTPTATPEESHTRYTVIAKATI